MCKILNTLNIGDTFHFINSKPIYMLVAGLSGVKLITIVNLETGEQHCSDPLDCVTQVTGVFTWSIL